MPNILHFLMFLHYSQITFKHRHTIYVVNVASKKLITMFQVNITREKIFLKMYDTGRQPSRGVFKCQNVAFCGYFFLVFPFTPLHTIPSLPTLFSLPLPIPLPLHPTSHFSSFLQRIIISHFFQR